MKLGVVEVTAHKYNNIMDKINYEKFRKVMMGILKTLVTFAVGVNIGSISVETLLQKYTFEGLGASIIKDNIGAILNLSHGMVFWGAQIFATILIIVLLLSCDGSKMTSKEFGKALWGILGGTLLLYMASTMITLLFSIFIGFIFMV